MTLLLVVLIVSAAHAALTFPSLTGRVVDDAHILSPASMEKLTGELQAEEQKSGNQIVVVTLPDLQGQEIEDYGYQLGRAWGIGQKGKDNGALIIVAPKEHRTRIEVGYGLEGVLTDAVTASIINTVMLPAFKTGDYDRGITQGTESLLSIINGGAVPEDAAQAAASSDAHSKFPAIALIGLLLFLMCFRGGRSFLSTMLIFSALGGGRGGGSGGGFGGGGGSFGGGGSSGRW